MFYVKYNHLCHQSSGVNEPRGDTLCRCEVKHNFRNYPPPLLILVNFLFFHNFSHFRP